MQHHATSSLDSESLRDLSRRTTLPWLRDAVLDWAVILGALAAAHECSNPAVWALAVLIVGNRQHALAILGHDGTHFALSHNRRLNDFLTNLMAFWSLGLTVSGYRALHYVHHKHTGTEHDPELGHKRLRSPQWDLPATTATILRYAFMDLLGCSVADYIIIIRFSKPQSKREYLPLALFHIAALPILLGLGWWQAAAVWYFSLVTSFMMFFRLRLWLEHQGTGDTQRLALTWWEGAILAPHNSWHHWEHHEYPTIPCHRLPQAREKLKGPAILTLCDLMASFASARPIPSGTALKVHAETGTPLPDERITARAA